MGTDKTALVTGASSGIGFETAAQLAETGFGRVIVAARTEQKSQDAKKRLEARTGRAVFEALAADLGDLATVESASDELKRRGNAIDVLILKLGCSPARNWSATRTGSSRPLRSW